MTREDSQRYVNDGYWPYAGIWLGGSAGNSGYGYSQGSVLNTGNFTWEWTNGSPGLYRFLIR